MAISSWTIVAMVTVALVFGGGRVAEGQSDCVAKLVPCADYLNSTKPSKDCCDAMRTVVTTQLVCLCGLINNPSALGGINLTQALELPKHCNLSSDTSACNAALSPRSSLPPPATPGGNGENAAGTISRMGMPTLLLASAFTIFY
ncbi:hypothetical protein C2S53_005779 [Perilla frutescens var. hirtella]|uniref:Bifunctional inhibitor/plant lipid transfer protein/seed storage helical domain-containing protein n=1 Tax=Perilla frutescens var. hirtella TaxID=608512 RepID=A0AAD4JBP5_PERFH|nr:hypothetical protein C2S53_005779 [Perilla frutescens var. hirtella]